MWAGVGNSWWMNKERKKATENKAIAGRLNWSMRDVPTLKSYLSEDKTEWINYFKPRCQKRELEDARDEMNRNKMASGQGLRVSTPWWEDGAEGLLGSLEEPPSATFPIPSARNCWEGINRTETEVRQEALTSCHVCAIAVL